VVERRIVEVRRAGVVDASSPRCSHTFTCRPVWSIEYHRHGGFDATTISCSHEHAGFAGSVSIS
jgi:hypothetical protein